ncbi:MAG: hypothetical protein BWY96_00183 [Spirochaetes bacterium ADurb.BinA120]|nr:MAG: hypothetical protein BWY96_00183 [Spirochaetes bacterium ADurb.BinA120]
MTPVSRSSRLSRPLFAGIFILCLACSDSSYEALKIKYPPESFDALFAAVKLSLVEAMETGVEGGFREIEYGEDDTGVFVRLLKGGRERGCIGFIRGVSSPEEAVKAAAVNAAFFDKRHKRLGPEELPSLEIEITVIDRLLRIRNHLDFTPGIHTIYIKHLNMKAVMQGQIIQERGYSKEEFLRAICRKGGIPETQYREKDAEIYRANTVFMRRRFADINTGR